MVSRPTNLSLDGLLFGEKRGDKIIGAWIGVKLKIPLLPTVSLVNLWLATQEVELMNSDFKEKAQCEP